MATNKSEDRSALKDALFCEMSELSCQYSFIFLRTTNFIINFSYKKGPLNYFIFQILLTASAVIQSLETSKYGKTWKPLILHIFGSQVCILEYDTLKRGMQVFLMISNKTVDDLHF